MSKKSFIIYSDQYDPIKDLSLEQKGKMLEMIFSYHLGNDYKPNDNLVEMAFSFFKIAFDRDMKKYNNICERNKTNGLKGGRPKKPKKPSGKTGNPKKPKKADSDSGNDSDSDNENNFITQLKNNPAYSHIDIGNELSKMDAWLLMPQNKKRKKTSRFILNWLNKIEKPHEPEKVKQLPFEQRKALAQQKLDEAMSSE